MFGSYIMYSWFEIIEIIAGSIKRWVGDKIEPVDLEKELEKTRSWFQRVGSPIHAPLHKPSTRTDHLGTRNGATTPKFGTDFDDSTRMKNSNKLSGRL